MNGTTTYSQRLLSKLVVAAAVEVPGVEAVSSSWAGLGARSYPRAEVTLDRLQERARVNCVLAVSWPAPITDIAERVQQNVRVWLTEMTGLEVVSVDVSVEQTLASTERVSVADLAASPSAPGITAVSAPGGIRVRRPSIREPRPLRPITVTPLFSEVRRVR